VRGVDLICARSAVRPLMTPYLRQTDFPRRVGHIDGLVIRGSEDVAARSTSVISLPEGFHDAELANVLHRSS
ncbi:hypothetical protein GW17_00026239, partial [Ensete ventricosum]